VKSKHPVEEWKSLWEKGLTFSEIAERYGVTRNTVASVKHQLTCPDYIREYEKQWSKTDSIKSWRKELQSRNELYGHLLATLPYYSKKWRILRAYLDGKTYREIGAEIGVTGETVAQQLRPLGIKKPPNFRAKTRALAKKQHCEASA
jgi:DNA-binding CsgD family transcriptional regulator